HHRAMAARPSEQAPFSLQNFLQNLQHTICGTAARHQISNVLFCIGSIISLTFWFVIVTLTVGRR
ncbi:hypothetical protein, partial [Mesorhizobium sp. M0590]|uniref:hypothetical protein n=1 Tax=Mesorhizobium sp. M0590 TaxID=2956966 RepID=UPI00333CA46E